MTVPGAHGDRSASTRGALLAAVALAGTLLRPALAEADAPPPILSAEVAAALAAEVSGSAALHTAQELTLHHRQRGSRGFAAAAEAIRGRAAAYGLEQVEVIRLPADGERFYGTQRSRPAWDAEQAELWELTRDAAASTGDPDSGWRRARRIASWDERPMTLAQDSVAGTATTDLVDVGAGTAPEDYAGKEIAGRLVLTSSQPGAVQALAVGRFGAAGIVSWAQNQRSAWWGEDESLVRWGHLDTFLEPRTFAFMVSPAQARAWQARLAAGETVRLEASVRAGQRPGAYEIVSAAISGGDPARRHEEIAFSCHLDHPRPGANDNASGCAAILEAARALAALVADGRLPRPARTLRFYWPAEIEGTLALLADRPEVAERTLAVIHMDMVGGDPAATKAVFHVTRSPASLPSVSDAVAAAVARFVDEQTAVFAASGEAPLPLVDPLGGKEPLRPRLAPFSMGSDHQVWSEGSWRVPAIYLNDWPDRYIHTTGDTIANLDATKLLRAAYLGAASAWVLASLDTEGLPALWQVVRGEALERTAAAWRRAATLRAGGDAGAASTLLTGHFARERSVLPSAARFADLPPAMLAEAVAFFDGLEGAVAGAGAADAAGVAPSPAPQAAAAAAIVYRRSGPPGPMTAFGYSWLDDQLARRDLPQPALLSVTTPWADGALLAYEALNLIDGRRGVATVYEQLASAYGPLPLAAVADYLAILGQVGVLAAADLQEATSRLGEPLLRPELSLPSQVHQESHLARARARLAAHPDDPDAWVWVGRRLAYLGRYREALAVYDRGLARHPDDAALLRHRGHRNLTLRRLDAAAADLERAAALVEGRPDVVERDGLPNLADVPTSTLQTNVWYHLALARWLQGDFAAARDAWRRCLDLAEHPDMQVAAAYWLYLAHRRLSEDEAAAAVAARFGPDLELLESHDYHRLLGVFRGETDPAVLLAEAAEGGELSLATTAYGLGAWALLEGDRETADARFRQAVAAGPWAAFGALAAEAELARSRQPPPPDDAL